jgi:deoxyribose-phosphate aldolase
MQRTVGSALGVKPSGGIRSYETACRYLDMGVQRLGVAATKEVLEGAPD